MSLEVAPPLTGRFDSVGWEQLRRWLENLRINLALGRVAPDSSSLSIVSNTITLPDSLGSPHLVTVGATGTLTTLSGGANSDMVILQAASGATVTLNEAGNLSLGSFGTFVLAAVQDKAWFINRGGSAWDALALRNN